MCSAAFRAGVLLASTLLCSWNLPAHGQNFIVCDTPELTLNPANAQRSSSIVVDDDIVLNDLLVTVNLTHSFIGDLQFFVTSPAGTQMQLHAGGGAGNDDLLVTYSTSGSANGSPSYLFNAVQQPAPDPWALLAVLGESSAGTWLFDIEDTVAQSGNGVVNEWCVVGLDDVPPFAPTNLFCLPFNGGEAASLIWDNHAPYDELTIYADGVPLGTIPGDAESASIVVEVSELVEICIEATLEGELSFAPTCCNVSLSPPPAPTQLECTLTSQALELAWDNNALYDAIEVTQDGEVVAVLAGNTTRASAPLPATPLSAYCVVGILGGILSDGACCEASPALAPRFIRGDVDNDGEYSLLIDPIILLAFGFLGGAPPVCSAAADIDGNLDVNALIDAVNGLAFGFQGGPPPPHPFPECGIDAESTTTLGCETPVCP